MVSEVETQSLKVGVVGPSAGWLLPLSLAMRDIQWQWRYEIEREGKGAAPDFELSRITVEPLGEDDIYDTEGRQLHFASSDLITIWQCIYSQLTKISFHPSRRNLVLTRRVSDLIAGGRDSHREWS